MFLCPWVFLIEAPPDVLTINRRRRIVGQNPVLFRKSSYRSFGRLIERRVVSDAEPEYGVKVRPKPFRMVYIRPLIAADTAMVDGALF